MIDKLLYKLLDEISYRNKTGIVNLQNENDIYILSEILTEWGWSDIKGELIQILLEKIEGDVLNDENDEDSSISDEENTLTKATIDTTYIQDLPDGDPAVKKDKEKKIIDETLESIGILLNEASIFDDKYGIGSRFLAITNTESLFKEGLPDGETIPKGFFTKVSDTENAIPVNLSGSGGKVVYVQANDTKKTYKITGSANKLQSMFGKMRKGASPKDINWKTDTLETAAAMGVFINGYSILQQLNNNVKTDDDLPKVIDDITRQVSKAFGKSGDYANIGEIESKIGNIHLADWYQLASLMAGMTKFTDSVIPSWSQKYIIHKSIGDYYKAIDRSELVQGTKQNTADMVISNTPISKLLELIRDEHPIEFDNDGICYIPNTDVKWIQVSLKKAQDGAQLGKIYGFLKNKFDLLDNSDVLDIALSEGISDFIQKGKDFIKNIGTSFMDKLKSLGDFMGKIGNAISKGFTKTPDKDLDTLQRELQQAGLKGNINEEMLYESKTIFETLEEIGADRKLLNVLVNNVNKKFDNIKNISNKSDGIWMTNIKQIKPKFPADGETVGKILSNYQGASVLETMIRNIQGDSKQLYRNLIELEKEMIYGKTILPLYKVFGMSFDDTAPSFKKYPGSEKFIEEKLGKELADVVVLFIRATEQGSDYYSLTIYGLNDIDEATGKFQYTQFRVGTNKSGAYTFNFEGVKFIELGKIKERLNIK